MKKVVAGILIGIIGICKMQTLEIDAAEDSKVMVTERYDISEVRDCAAENQNADVLGNSNAKGTTVPTAYWDLSVHNLIHEFSGMTATRLTDYVFSPDSNGCISIRTIDLNTNGGNLTISLMRSGVIFEHTVSSWTGNPQSIQGLGFSGLDTNKVYYIKFTPANGTSLNGYCTIHHP